MNLPQTKFLSRTWFVLQKNPVIPAAVPESYTLHSLIAYYKLIMICFCSFVICYNFVNQYIWYNEKSTQKIT